MGLNFNRPDAPTQTAPAAQAELEQVKSYDIVVDRKQMSAELVGSKEVDDIVSTIEVNNLETIVSFGAEVAEEISKASDVVLNSMDMTQLDESSRDAEHAWQRSWRSLILDEIKGKSRVCLDKLFGGLAQTAGQDSCQISYDGRRSRSRSMFSSNNMRSEIKQSNRKLETMFEANVNYYHELVKYILAGEQGCQEMEAYIAQRQADMEATGDQSIQFELTSLNQALMMLEQRTQDLRTAENVAMQSIPMIKTMAFSNMNLVRKINSAFIVTLPVFKQALAQAIMLKRQKIQAEAMSALDQKTNEMLIKNAQNTVEQSKMTAQTGIRQFDQD